MTNAPEVEARVCPVCKLQMAFSRGVYRCVNADGVQPQEQHINPETGLSYERQPSGWDELHEADWAAKIAVWYPNQPKSVKV